jgi:hypothetical protein
MKHDEWIDPAAPDGGVASHAGDLEIAVLRGWDPTPWIGEPRADREEGHNAVPSGDPAATNPGRASVHRSVRRSPILSLIGLGAALLFRWFSWWSRHAGSAAPEALGWGEPQ